jgi:hypothetical protein
VRLRISQSQEGMLSTSRLPVSAVFASSCTPDCVHRCVWCCATRSKDCTTPSEPAKVYAHSMCASTECTLPSRRAAEEANKEHGISPVVIDLRTLLPWDAATLSRHLSTVEQTHCDTQAPVTSGFRRRGREYRRCCGWRPTTAGLWPGHAFPMCPADLSHAQPC